VRGVRAALLVAIALCGCSAPPPEPVKQYKLHGEVVRLDAQGNLAIIRHQKIDGWMEAMTMTFPVKDAQDFAGLHANDCIDATVFVQGDSFWVGQIAHQPAEPGMCVQAPPAAK
jgi:Cu/Ag efflux protein CusF